ncbi:4-diphosphocytidyl-2-C-methyl-D-erythritol kinase [subsurface metagenome]
MLTVLAPAKLNLTLEVLAERSDGFHEIRSVAQTINLCDSLRFQLSESIEFTCADSRWLPGESLVSKATRLLQKTTGCSQGAKIEVEKRIPLISGLSGDSSDAAAVLNALNRLWELGLSLSQLVELASQLGSDVAFFLYNGTALLKGRGEVVTPLPPLPHMNVVVMLPPVPRVPGKTGRLYASLPPSHYTQGEITERLVARLTEENLSGEGLVGSVFNVLADVALENFAGLGGYREQFLKAGAQQVYLAGSGPALFTLIENKAQAEKIYRRLQKQGFESYLTDTLDVIDK